MQNQYKCVILVIASHSPAFDKFKRMWVAHWEASKENVFEYECFYLYNNDSSFKRKGRDLYFPYEETYPAPGLLLKTIGALRYLKETGVTYDMLFRTNLSSLIDWAAFRAFIYRHHLSKNVVAGVMYGEKQMSGMCMLLSGNLAQLLLENEKQLNYEIPDDHAINTYFLGLPNIEYIYFGSKSNERPIHQRFQSGWVEGNMNRERDHASMALAQKSIIEHFQECVTNQPHVAWLVLLMSTVAVISMVSLDHTIPRFGGNRWRSSRSRWW